MGVYFQNIVIFCSGIGSICTAAALLIKPIRDKLLGFGAVRDGQKCVLRAEMLRTYYRHREENTIRQYEYENFLMLYRAYKRLGGNSFIDDIAEEVRKWEVLS